MLLRRLNHTHVCTHQYYAYIFCCNTLLSPPPVCADAQKTFEPLHLSLPPPPSFLFQTNQVVSIRHQLLAEDCTGCLQLLMRYPPDQGVSTAISLSLSLAKGQSLAAFQRSTEPSSFVAASSGRAAAPSSSSEIQQEPAPVWLNRGGRDHGSDSGRSPSATGSAGHAPSEWRRDGGGGGGVGGAEAGGRPRAFGRDERLETEREAKNNWQQGLDEFTRRWEGAGGGAPWIEVACKHACFWREVARVLRVFTVSPTHILLGRMAPYPWNAHAATGHFLTAWSHLPLWTFVTTAVLCVPRSAK